MVDLSSEISLILKEGEGLGTDKSLILLSKELNEINSKIHVVKMVKFACIFEKLILTSGLEQEDIKSIEIQDGWYYVGANNENAPEQDIYIRVLLEDISNSEKVKKSVILNENLNVELAGIGRIRTKFFNEKNSYSECFQIEPIFNNLKDQFLINTLSKELYSSYVSELLNQTLPASAKLSQPSPKI